MKDEIKEININFDGIIDYIRDKDMEILSLQNKLKNLEDYKSKLEKAIEYIEENCIDDEYYMNLSYKEKNIIEALKILKGE